MTPFGRPAVSSFWTCSVKSLVFQLPFYLTLAVASGTAKTDLIEKLNEPIAKPSATITSKQELGSLLSLGPSKRGDSATVSHFPEANAQTSIPRAPKRPCEFLALDSVSKKAQVSSVGALPAWSATDEALRGSQASGSPILDQAGSSGNPPGTVEFIRIDEYRAWRLKKLTFPSVENRSLRMVTLDKICEAMGIRWLSTLELQGEEDRLLNFLTMKWTDTNQNVSPQRSILSVLHQVDYATKLNLHYISIIHGLYEPPLFQNDLGLRQAQIKAFRHMSNFWDSLTLRALGQKEKNTNAETAEQRAVRHIMSAATGSSDRNSLAWIIALSWVKAFDNDIRRLVCPSIDFHKDFKILVNDKTIAQARQDGIECSSHIVFTADVRLKRDD